MAASIELVTSHQGTAHIQATQIKDLVSGLEGNTDKIARFADVGGGMKYKRTAPMEITIYTGMCIAGGWIIELASDYEFIPYSAMSGYSMISELYLVIYEDPITEVQTADFVEAYGASYPNGSEPKYPAEPSGGNIIQTFLFMRVIVKSATPSTITILDMTEEYLTSSEVSGNVGTLRTLIKPQIENIWSALEKVVYWRPFYRTVNISGPGDTHDVVFTLTPSKPGLSIVILGITPCVSGNSGAKAAAERVTSDYTNGEYHINIRVRGISAGNVTVWPTAYYLEI